MTRTDTKTNNDVTVIPKNPSKHGRRTDTNNPDLNAVPRPPSSSERRSACVRQGLQLERYSNR